LFKFIKGLGKAHRFDEAFRLLESVENGTAVGSPKLSAPLVFGLLNALAEAGELDISVSLIPIPVGSLLFISSSIALNVFHFWEFLTLLSVHFFLFCYDLFFFLINFCFCIVWSDM